MEHYQSRWTAKDQSTAPLPPFPWAGHHFEECHFEGLDLNHSDWRDARFERCTFQSCSLSEVRLTNVRFHGVTFYRLHVEQGPLDHPTAFLYVVHIGTLQSPTV